jgi:hypothetical protein
MKIVFLDGSWIVGDRNNKAIGYLHNHETKGTHHYFVIGGSSEEYKKLIGQEIAVPINSVKYFVLNYKDGK